MQTRATPSHVRPAASVAALLFIIGCGSSFVAGPGGSGASGHDGADASSDAAPGAVGEHVWTTSSVRLALRHVTSYDGPNGVQGGSTQCWYLDRSALSDAQRTLLETLTLVPLTDACTADGFDYDELTVVDADGAQAVYRDTGCSFLRVPGAQAMIPPGAFTRGGSTADGGGFAFSSADAVPCIDGM